VPVRRQEKSLVRIRSLDGDVRASQRFSSLQKQSLSYELARILISVYPPEL
jgi:hypothetical protein